MHPIRRYKPSDLSAVIDIYRRSVHEVACCDYSPEQLAAWAPAKMDMHAWSKRLAEGGVFVADQAGTLTGFIRVDAQGHIDLLFVHPDFQRQGIALRLFQAADGWACDAGVTQLTADVSLTARPFFERVGFQVVTPQVVERNGVELTNFQMVRSPAPQGTD
ncbi:MAG: GNAT family N-acetyltransferase [Pirellulaceae bacterium]